MVLLYKKRDVIGIQPMIMERKFPTWHFSMLNDKLRNEAIKEAITYYGVDNKVVLEIGTGAGLTAIYFAKHGAKVVYTCEMDEQLYHVAVKNIKENNFENIIKIYHMTSSELIKSGIMKEPPDVIFTETLDCGIVGEGFWSVAKDIRTIASSNTKIIPDIIKQYGFMIESEEIYNQNKISGNFNGIKLTHINDHSTTTYFPIRYNNFNVKTLSESMKINEYTYTTLEHGIRSSKFIAYRTGICHGIISYFQARMGPSIISNDLRDKGHWHQAFHPLQEPINVKAGNTYIMKINKNGSITIVSEKG
ncbi:Ribosomal protein L11 methyltransferase [Xenorhabdus mauleonii]|uniref:Ribosomal protein L11 methyltransferase n=1 Tax=Xenorhabdus mauleonii TaxID=351675 RepID=A0A1I3PKU6_9GAMM|nr:50S ribosomal protein L11 methyltransferase [Xenorhabdus mauleonii]PHM44770.1 Ribosomal protein L11 methyltransferase [Xenorhabdus mauleonii]SFJ21989.1 type II protein arginine methyltransferase [Xenorhabdus mauleonii]